MSKEINTKLKLGDIIKIEAETNTDLNNKEFFINYIDKSEIVIINSESDYIIRLEDGKIMDKSIQKIILLSRSEKEGFIKQNNLDINFWVDLNFGGDLPETFTGKITNIEGDMIEVTRYPDTSQIIYIDFAYSGIPRDIDLNNIVIRESPKKIEDINLPNEEETEEITDEYINQEEQVLEGEIITNLNQLVLGEELEALQFEKVDKKQKRFGLDIQEKDMVDDMISKLKEKDRTNKKINEIHKVVEKFKRLRKDYSNYDVNGNVMFPIKKKGAKYKPLLISLTDMKDKINFLIPVINSGRLILDIDNTDERFDIYPDHTWNFIDQYNIAFDKFKSNDVTFGENNYNTFVASMNNIFQSYKDISEYNGFSKDVNDNIECLISNYDDLVSSSFNNGKIQDTKFVMSRHNKGLHKRVLEKDVFKDDQRMMLEKLSNGESIKIHSFMMLPKEIIQKKCDIRLINLLEKIKRKDVFSNEYTQVFNSNKKIVEHNIKSLNGDIDYSFDDINLFSLDETILKNHLLRDELYNEFLDIIIPRTGEIIKKSKEDLERYLSLYDIEKYLEPFMIYHDTLTFKQYEMIDQYIYNNRKLYVKRIKKVNNMFYDYKSKLKNNFNEKFGYKEEKNKYRMNFNYRYINLDEINYTESEIITDSLSKDFSNSLISSLVDSELLDEENNNMLIEYFKKKYSNDSKKNDNCDPTILVAKKYRKLKELEKDNGINIYFDSEYDDTVYDLNNIYEKEKASLSVAEYKNFIKNKLSDINGINDENVDYIVSSIVDGKKKVIDGQYGLLEKIGDGGEDDIEGMYYNYYIRDKDQWIYDSETTEKNKFKMLLQPSCDVKLGCVEDEGIYIQGKSIRKDEDCISKNEYLMRIKKKILKKMITEFEHTYDYSIEKMKKYIEYTLNKHSLELSDNIKNIISEKLKYNNYLYQLSLTSPEGLNIPNSPNKSLLDKILQQEDINKKNDNIVLFCKYFTRDAINDENVNWKYCKDTGVELLPLFRYELAYEYIKDTSFYKENYKNALNRIRVKYGELSEDGDKWVSKEGGWKIMDVEEFSGEQYGPSGFKEVSEAIDVDEDDIEMDEDEEILNEVNTLLDNKKDIFEFKQLYLNANSKIVYEIIVIFIKELSISLNQETLNFIIKHVNKSFQLHFYKDDISDRERDKVLLILTLSCVLLGIQLKVKNIISTKTVGTCKTSFTGFPVFSEDGVEGVEYISCVAYSLRTKKTSLFKLFNKVKEENIKEAIIKYTTDYVLTFHEIQSLIYEYKNLPKEITSDEVDLKKWNNFQPQLLNVNLSTINNVSSDFLPSLIGMMKKGSYEYLYKLNILKGKTIQLSYYFMNLIQKIILKKKLLLMNKKGEYFLENSCCDEDHIKSPVEYFNDEDRSILNYHDMIVFNSESIQLINSVITPKMLILSLLKLPLSIENVSTKTVNDNNIYQAIIYYCKIGDEKNVKRYSLRNVCKDMNIRFNSNDSLTEKIEKLKNEGYNFNYNNLIELMQIINSENRIKVKLSSQEISRSDKMRNILEDNNLFTSNDINEKLYNIFDNYDAVSSNTSQEENILLQTYIYDENDKMQIKITNFLEGNISYSNTDRSRVNKFLDSIIKFNKNNDMENIIEDDYYHKNITYIKGLVNDVSILLPEIVINKNDITRFKFPPSWNNMSKTHKNRVASFIEESYTKFKKFFGRKYLDNFFQRLIVKIKKYNSILEIIPTHDTIITRNTLIEPLLSSKTILYIYKYVLLKVFENYVDLSNEISEEIPIEDKNEFLNNVGMFIFLIINSNIDDLKVIDINYEYIMKKVNSQKEKEKKEITDELRDLNEQEKEVELFKKKYKNDGRWALAAKKELTKYGKTSYDSDTLAIGDMNNYLMAELNEQNNISELGEDYHDGVDVNGMMED